MKRYLLQWTIAILGWMVLATAADAQQISRTKAIAQIAAQFPNSEKSPEQIYDEAQIWQVAKTFAKQFRNLDLGALTGPIEEDRYRTVTREVPGPVGSVNDSSSNTPPRQGPPIPGETVSDTTNSEVVNESEQSTQTVTERIERHSIFFSEGHTITTTAEQDYTEADRRAIRKTFLSMFEGLPRDVRIVIELESVAYHGYTATVTAKWKYDIVGHVTRLSRPYQDRSPGFVSLQMLRVGDAWRVTDFRGLVNGLKADVTGN